MAPRPWQARGHGARRAAGQPSSRLRRAARRPAGRPARPRVGGDGLGSIGAARPRGERPRLGAGAAARGARRADPSQRGTAGSAGGRAAGVVRGGRSRAGRSPLDHGSRRHLAHLGRPAARHVLPPAHGRGDRDPPVGRDCGRHPGRSRRGRGRRAPRALRTTDPGRAAERGGRLHPLARHRHRGRVAGPPVAWRDQLRARSREGGPRVARRAADLLLWSWNRARVDDRFETFGDLSLLEAWRTVVVF